VRAAPEVRHGRATRDVVGQRQNGVAVIESADARLADDPRRFAERAADRLLRLGDLGLLLRQPVRGVEHPVHPDGERHDDEGRHEHLDQGEAFLAPAGRGAASSHR
jgi:hypothetical protein